MDLLSSPSICDFSVLIMSSILWYCNHFLTFIYLFYFTYKILNNFLFFVYISVISLSLLAHVQLLCCSHLVPSYIDWIYIHLVFTGCKLFSSRPFEAWSQSGGLAAAGWRHCPIHFERTNVNVLTTSEMVCLSSATVPGLLEKFPAVH